MTTPTIHELAAAAEAFMLAAGRLHTTHPTTDVHGHGGVAGQAITPHCHWRCNVLGAHQDTRAAFTDTRRTLAHLLERALEPAPQEVPFPQYRVQATRGGPYASEPLSFADAVAALPLYRHNHDNRFAFGIATRATSADDEWTLLSPAELSYMRVMNSGEKPHAGR